MDDEIAVGALGTFVGGAIHAADVNAKIRVAALAMLEEERRRLGRELHDETGQILTAALFQLDICLADLTPKDGALTERLQGIRDALLVASHDLRRLAHALCPPMLDELGLVPTLSWLVRTFQEQYRVAASLSAPEVAELPRSVEVALFRIVQESLTNVAKHARARSVRVELRVGTDIVICLIVDDGQGFDVGQRQMTSLGLVGIRERARQYGGDVAITSASGRGTSVQAIIPLTGGEDD